MNLTTYIIVKDMGNSLAFYKDYFTQELGSGCPERFAIFDVGSTSLALYNPQYDEVFVKNGADSSRHFNDAYLDSKDVPVTYGNNVVLNIGVDDLSAEYERIKALNIYTSEPLNLLKFLSFAIDYE